MQLLISTPDTSAIKGEYFYKVVTPNFEDPQDAEGCAGLPAERHGEGHEAGGQGVVRSRSGFGQRLGEGPLTSAGR